MRNRRERLTWAENRRPGRRTAMRRTADPYTMNMERRDPGPNKYQGPNSTPEGWADVPHPGTSWRQERRNPMSVGEMRDDTFGAPRPVAPMAPVAPEMEAPAAPVEEAPMEPRPAMASRSRQAEARLEAKAAKCIRIARMMLPSAPRGVIKNQAVDLMEMTDSAIASTLRRHLAHSSKTAEEEAEKKLEAPAKTEKKEEEKVTAPAAPAAPATSETPAAPATPATPEAPKAEETKTEEKKEEKKESSVIDEILSEGEDKEEEEEEEKEKKGSDGEIEMEASVMDSSEIPAEEGNLLDDLFRDLEQGLPSVTSRKKESTAPAKAGVKSLRQVVASKSDKSGSEKLQGLWKSDPDVSGVFG